MLSRKLLRVFWIGYLLFLPVAAGVVIALGPFRLGDGTVGGAVRWLEGTDLRWWIVLGLAVAWLGPLVTMLLWRRGALEVVYRALEGRSLPMQVDVAGTIPVRFDQAVRVPVEVKGRIAIDETLEIQADIPVRVTLPIETEVQTSVLGLGRVRVPIRATVPLDLVIPLHTRARVSAPAIPVDLREEAVVTFPAVDLPVSARVEARVDLGVNLRNADAELRRVL